VAVPAFRIWRTRSQRTAILGVDAGGGNRKTFEISFSNYCILIDFGKINITNASGKSIDKRPINYLGYWRFK
jgi:hypothetical protein